MPAFVKKWGNSAAVRIPAAVLADAGLDIDHPVEIREERGRVVIEPLRRKQFALKDLLQRITPKNLHGPIDTGGRVGREIW
jgi:antitoxin MazE